MRTLHRAFAAAVAALTLFCIAPASGADVPYRVSATSRIKDLANIEGVRQNQLIGYGLVVGLNGTGDTLNNIPFTKQSLQAMLERLGVNIRGATIRTGNVAAVMVTANLPAFGTQGTRIDVTVSSLGDAKSLQGGTLLPTGLRGPDGATYGLAQGPLTLGGFGGGGGGNSVVVNHLTAGRVPGGGMIQMVSRAQLPASREITLALHEPDFVSASRVADAINKELGGGAARAIDSANVTVKIPENNASVSDFMARLEPITVSVDEVARVVINERTGTVVVGSHVTLGPAAVAHGNLQVSISTQNDVSQPAPMSGPKAQTVVVPQTSVSVKEGGGQLIALEEGTTLYDVVRALNALGATPRDIIAIMQALKAAGALRAELVII